MLPISRSIGRRALASRFEAITSTYSRSFRSSDSSISLDRLHVVDKNAAPPKASSQNPVGDTVGRLDKPRVAQKRRPQKKIQRKRQKTHPPPPRSKQEVVPSLPTSGWVTVHNIPPMSTLADMLHSINKVMDAQADGGGILDLDAVWKGGGQVSLLERDSSEDWVRSARLMLSKRGRPKGWGIEFQNRSMARAFLEYARAHPIHCAWKPVSVTEGHMPGGNELAETISDSMIRVENADRGVSVDHIRHLFRRYDLTKVGPSVRELSDGPSS